MKSLKFDNLGFFFPLLQCLELLLKKSNIRAAVNSNAKNSNGLTAIDVLDTVMANADDLHTREILEQAGIVKSKASLFRQYCSLLQQFWLITFY